MILQKNNSKIKWKKLFKKSIQILINKRILIKIKIRVILQKNNNKIKWKKLYKKSLQILINKRILIKIKFRMILQNINKIKRKNLHKYDNNTKNKNIVLK